MSSSEAGASIDRIAKSYVEERRISLREAYKLVMEENPSLAAEYNNSANDTPVRSYELSVSEQVMKRMQVDRSWVQRLAGDLLASRAQQLAGSNPRGGQVSAETFAAAMKELMTAFPDLATAYSVGVVEPGNWQLVATLQPGTATEIKRTRGVDPHNLRSGRYAESSASVHKYGGESQHIRYDRNGEYRVYTFER